MKNKISYTKCTWCRLLVALFILNGFCPALSAKVVDTISIAGVGDIMLGTNFPANPKYLPEDCSLLMKNVNQYLQSADITFGNLEASIADSAKLEKKCKDTTACYAFRMPLKFADCLAQSGFDVLSLANNHICDFGMDGQKSTIKVLDSLHIYNAGLQIKPYTIFFVDSIKIGFTAFSPNKGVNHINDSVLLKRILKKMQNEDCSVIIVSFHGGAEGADYEHIPFKEEIYYGENRGNVHRFAHMAIDNGADVVFGHGPHVTRAFEIYKDRFIAYSLGNFCTYERFKLSGPNGIAPIVKLQIDTQGKLISGKVIPTRQLDPGIVYVDKNKRVIHRLNELMAHDFPDSGFHIEEDGTFAF